MAVDRGTKGHFSRECTITGTRVLADKIREGGVKGRKQGKGKVGGGHKAAFHEGKGSEVRGGWGGCLVEVRGK